MTDRSTSLSSNVRILGSSQRHYEQLTSRLTPKIINHESTIKISTKNTPTNNQPISQIYSQVKKNRWADLNSSNWLSQSSPENIILKSPRAANAIEQSIISSKIQKSSYLSSSTVYDKQKQLKTLKQNMQAQKNYIQTLEATNSKLQLQLSESLIKIQTTEQIDLRNKLQQTEERMGEQNAYLRQSMFKLQEQLQYINRSVVVYLKQQIEFLQQQNKNFCQQIKFNNIQLKRSQQDYKNLLLLLQSQKNTGQIMNKKLVNLQDKIVYLQSQNNTKSQQIQKISQINDVLSKKIQKQKQFNRELEQGNSLIKKDIENHKQIAQQLRISMVKLRQQNVSSNKFKNETITPKYKNTNSSKSVFQRSSLSSRVSLKPLINSPSITNLKQPQGFEFSLSVYITKTQELNIIKQNLNCVNKQFNYLLSLAQYFQDCIQKLLNEQVKNQKVIQKYKRIIQLIPNSKQDNKINESIEQLISKCYLLQSSIEQKKDVIDRLNEKINQMAKEKEIIIKDKHFKSQQQPYERIKLFNHRYQRQTNNQTKGRLSQGAGIFERFKQFKPNTFVDQKQSSQFATISENKIKQQLLIKLKKYQQDIIPQLKAQINQHKETIMNFDKLDDSRLNQSSLTYTSKQQIQSSRISRVWSNSFDKLKQRVVGLSRPFQQYGQKPGTSQSLAHSNNKKKRLDLINRTHLNKEIILNILSKLLEIGKTMSKNNNFMTILPDSIYIVNYSEENLCEGKIKVLQTSKIKNQITKRYWAPENIKGESFCEMSLVWNIGKIFDEFVHGKGSFEQHSKLKFFDQKAPIFKKIIQSMLEINTKKRGSLESIQQLIIKNKMLLK